MVSTTSAALIAAANDQHLYARIRALAATLGWTDQDLSGIRAQLVAAPVSSAGESMASVYAYALATYDPPPTPGEDPAAVTDDHILYAIQQTLGTSSTGSV